MIGPITEPLYQLAVTLDQLQDLQTLLETTSAGEADPDAKVFQRLHLVRKTRIEAVKFKQRKPGTRGGSAAQQRATVDAYGSYA
ncbi:hypothetical protein [Pseudomonas yamanorum]|uniref:hypothetical protein n=1 Tax=Pseudomonas yamanorum TaxID=515393 RepID=UPI003D35D183